MSQDWVANLYTTTTVVDTTMSNMELMFATLKSSFSGTSAPANAVMGQVWYDANTSYKCLQVRDYSNAAWRGVMAGSSSCKVWLYLNAVEEGWTIDSSVTDKVLALKGGSTYVAGATTAGTWTISGLTKDAHTHSYAHTHGINHTHTASAGSMFAGTPSYSQERQLDSYVGSTTSQNTSTSGNQSDSGITSAGTWRISAAVGIMAAPSARG